MVLHVTYRDYRGCGAVGFDMLDTGLHTRLVATWPDGRQEVIQRFHWLYAPSKTTCALWGFACCGLLLGTVVTLALIDALLGIGEVWMIYFG